MILLIIRHGESEADILHVHEGRADFELTERGHGQAAAMARYVAGQYPLTRIYASPLKRAAQTARHLAQASGLEICFEPDLMEFNNGLLAGLSFEEADRLYPRVENLPPDQAVYGQETKNEFRHRGERVLERVLSENDADGVVALVTHGGMVNQLYGAMLDIPVGGGSFFRTDDTGIHVWEITDRGCCVLAANRHDHAREK